MRLPVLLDLYCGAGGAAAGYYRAGFGVVGVDEKPQPRYPFMFIQGDALDFLRRNWREFDAVHASPPCHEHSTLNAVNRIEYGTGRLLAATRDELEESTLPWVIENVPGAPMRDPITLCGSEFDLRTTWDPWGEVWLRRHRLFESDAPLRRKSACACRGRYTVGVYGGGAGGSGNRVKGPGHAQASREVMGIDWMNRAELDQAIPPAYTEWIGRQLIERVVEMAA